MIPQCGVFWMDNSMVGWTLCRMVGVYLLRSKISRVQCSLVSVELRHGSLSIMTSVMPDNQTDKGEGVLLLLTMRLGAQGEVKETSWTRPRWWEKARDTKYVNKFFTKLHFQGQIAIRNVTATKYASLLCSGEIYVESGRQPDAEPYFI